MASTTVELVSKQKEIVTLSKKAEAQLDNPNPIFDLFVDVFANMYSERQTDGYVSVGVAENSLMHEWLSDYFNKNFKLGYDDFTYGSAMNGSIRLFKSLCNFFNTRFSPLIPVQPSHLVAGAGLSAVLDQLVSMLCDEGQGVMIPTPYYNGFDNDIQTRNGCPAIPIPIPTSIDPASRDAVKIFEDVYNATSPKPRAVLLTNPHNPLGFCYSRETIVEHMKMCEKLDMHLIVDEVYAYSTYSQPPSTPSSAPAPLPFISALSINPLEEAGCNPSRIHVIYGMSKDFCANGLRVGVLVSQNSDRLTKAFTASAIFMKVSSPSDMLWSTLLDDAENLDWFLKENARRLGDAYTYITSWLDRLEIPYRPCYAGHFVFINLQKLLPIHDKEGKELAKGQEQETALFMKLLLQGRVYLAPGASYHAQEPGWFRLTFAMRRDYLNVALQRIEALLFAKETNGFVEKAVQPEVEDVRGGYRS